MIRRPPISTRTDTLFPYTTLFRSIALAASWNGNRVVVEHLAASTPWVGRAQIDGVAILHPDAIELRPVHTQGFAVASIDGVFGYGKLSDPHLKWQKIAWPPDTANAGRAAVESDGGAEHCRGQLAKARGREK